MMKCKLCNNDGDVNPVIDTRDETVTCKQCGSYNTYNAAPIRAEDRHIIAGYLYDINNRKSEEPFDLSSKKIKSILSDPIIPKTFYEKLQKTLLYYYKQNDIFEKVFIVNQSSDYTFSYAKNRDEFRKFVRLLKDEGYFDVNQFLDAAIKFSITLKGINEAERLSKDVNYHNQVFVAMGYYDDLLKAFENAIKPACDECNHLSAVILKDIKFNGDINDRIIAEIKASKFLIADFTYNNMGAYFEAGFAQGYGLEVIRTCKKSWFDEIDEHGAKKNKLHFDVEHYNFILWENEPDLQEKLIYRIKAQLM